ncbi:four-carbon acid sugar kinase family protein [Aureibacillus halotolerans]|uniref:Uncharacterized protein YgbK (DUF1537 family) n=1 Tax=Aureibacillus halotolerans TaxID=1508390 RepID=A0A4R6U3V2_9BACI|nr:four-carbon acid sugar kinase family protein [Aureibacillus halotolerans]TDQ41100.1 uncharacterized protein YgbK (DUF1537 family) [Aureibacillus halotolerans]
MNNIVIIADDLTGASDCGATLLPYGMDVLVRLDGQIKRLGAGQSIVLNTDSRSLSSEDAYRRTAQVASEISAAAPEVVYKKMDSTMRGNIGRELDALYEVLAPDIVIAAPGLPSQGRVVKDGVLLLHNVPLAETEVANDPKTPVTESNIHTLIAHQSNHQVAHLSIGQVRAPREDLVTELRRLAAEKTAIVTADSVEDTDLRRLCEASASSGLRVVYAGSAGLIHYLPEALGRQVQQPRVLGELSPENVLFVVGSVSTTGRSQLKQLMASGKNITFIEVYPEQLLQKNFPSSDDWKRLVEKAGEASDSGRHIVLFSSPAKPAALDGNDAIEQSDRIAAMLGELAAFIAEHKGISRLFLTGGDTAVRVMENLHAGSLQLLGEIEPGVPYGKLSGSDRIAVTKAGSFGSADVMEKALVLLKGVDHVEADYRNYNG